VTEVNINFKKLIEMLVTWYVFLLYLDIISIRDINAHIMRI